MTSFSSKSLGSFWHTEVRCLRLKPKHFKKLVTQPLLALRLVCATPITLVTSLVFAYIISSRAFPSLSLCPNKFGHIFHLMVSTPLWSSKTRTVVSQLKTSSIVSATVSPSFCLRRTRVGLGGWTFSPHVK